MGRALKRIGLTGGIATGKSTVAKIFSELGFFVINADELARKVVEKGTYGWKKVVETFGREILLPNGSIDRKKLGNIVFSNLEAKKKLERIIHPLVIDEMEKILKVFEKEHPCEPIIIEIPLLFEVGLHKKMDKTIVVYAPKNVQIERMMKRDGLTYQEAEMRLKNQMDIEEKRKLADYVVDNSSSLEYTKTQVEKLARELRKL